MKEIGIQDRETPKPLESLGHASVRCGVVCYYCWLALLDLFFCSICEEFSTLILMPTTGYGSVSQIDTHDEKRSKFNRNAAFPIDPISLTICLLLALAACASILTILGTNKNKNLGVLTFPLEAHDSSTVANVKRVSMNVNIGQIHIPICSDNGENPLATYSTRVFNGASPGPTIRLKPGDTLFVTTENNLEANPTLTDHKFNTLRDPNITNIHFHGMHITPFGRGDNPFRTFAPNTTHSTKITLPLDHPSGLFWYHPHHHGSSTLQVSGGMAGLIVVEDVETDPITFRYLQECRDIEILLQTLNFCCGASRDLRSIMERAGDQSILALEIDPKKNKEPYVMANGKVAPRLNVNANEKFRLRLANGGTSDLLFLKFGSSSSSCAKFILAKDGVNLNRPRRIYDADTVSLIPGGRVDVVMQCLAGRLNVSALPQASVSASANEFLGTQNDVSEQKQVLAIIVGSGSTDHDSLERFVQETTNLRLKTPKPSTNKHESNAVPPFEFKFETGPKVSVDGSLYTSYGINGNSMQSGLPRRTMKIGETETWRVSSNSPDTQHPFHMHTNHFTIVDWEGGGGDFEVGEHRDTILIPSNGSVTVMFTPQHFTGRTMCHCHTFSHSDTGMGFVFEIVDDSEVGAINLGGDADAHGCRASAGYSYCEPLKRCIRQWENECKRE